MKLKKSTIAVLISALTCSVAVTSLLLTRINKQNNNDKVNDIDPSPFTINEEVVARDDIFSEDNKSIFAGYIGNYQDLMPKRLNDDNEDLSLTKPKIGYQVAYSDKDSNGINDHISIRYTAAINSLNVDTATWTRAMYKNNGDAYQGLLEANKVVTTAYSGVAYNGTIYYATDVEDDFGNKPYNYFVLYTLLDIPLEGYGKYYLDASLTLTKGEESITSTVGAIEVDTEDAFSYERGTLSSLLFNKKDNNTFSVRGDDSSDISEIVIPGYYNNGEGRYKVDEVENRAFKDFYNLQYLEVPDVTYVGAEIVNRTDAKVLFRSNAPKNNWHADFNDYNSMVFNYFGYYGQKDNMVYAVSKDGDDLYATVISAVYEDNYYEYAISSDYLSVPVVAIADNCLFNTLANVYTLDIPATVKSIGKHAFDHYFSLDYVTGCAGLEEIKDYAFNECRGLKGFPLSNVKTIGDYAFYYCNYLEGLLIFNSVESIGEYAFRECTSLSFIYLPDTLTSVGKAAFERSQAIILAESPSKPNGWSNDFLGDNSDDRYASCNVYYNAKEGVNPFIYEENKIKYGIFEANNGNKQAVIIKADYTLSGDITIPSVVNGATVMAVMACAFSFLPVTSVILPSTVTYIGAYAFSDCDSLETLNLGGIASLEMCTLAWSGNSSDDGNNPIGINNIIWPNTLRTIKSRGLQGFRKEQIVIPDTVTEIETEAFYGLEDTTRVIYVPSSVNTITGNMFIEDTTNDLFIYTPKAFLFCEASAKPNGWARHWNYGLITEWNCTLWDGMPMPDFNSFAFVDASDNFSFVLDENNNAYIKSYRGSSNEVTIPEEIRDTASETYYPVVGIGDWAFFNNNSVTTVNLADSIMSIGTSAFRYSNLQRISGARDLQTIGDFAFDHLYSLTDITIGRNYEIANIGDYAFNNCENMNMPNLWVLEYIGEYAFNKCRCFKDEYKGVFPLSSSTQVVGKGAFANTNTILISEAASKPASWSNDIFADGSIESESIIWNASDWSWAGEDSNGVNYFYYTIDNREDQTYAMVINASEANNTNIVIPDHIHDTVYFYNESIDDWIDKEMDIPVTRVGNEAFLGCSEIVSIDLPDSVTMIGNSAFKECYGLESIDLGNVVAINASTFAYTPLQEITLPNSVKAIRNGAFYESRIRNFIIPSSVLTLEEGAFAGADYLQNLFIPSSVITIAGDLFEGGDEILSKRSLLGASRYGLTIYCEVNNRPSGWFKYWNGTKEVVWGYSLPTD